MNELTLAAVVIAFLVVVGVLAVLQMWFSHRINRSLQIQNFRLQQCNLVLSEKPSAIPMALQAENTRLEEIKAERDQTLAASGAQQQDNGRRPRMQI